MKGHCIIDHGSFRFRGSRASGYAYIADHRAEAWGYSLEIDQRAPKPGLDFELMRRDTLYLALSLVWLAILITVIFFTMSM